MKNTDVLFSGYKVPHPLENRFLLRIQTSKDTHPTAAVHRSAQDLIEELSLFEQKFKVFFPFSFFFFFFPFLFLNCFYLLFFQDEVERRRERIPESSYR